MYDSAICFLDFFPSFNLLFLLSADFDLGSDFDLEYNHLFSSVVEKRSPLAHGVDMPFGFVRPFSHFSSFSTFLRFYSVPFTGDLFYFLDRSSSLKEVT